MLTYKLPSIGKIAQVSVPALLAVLSASVLVQGSARADFLEPVQNTHGLTVYAGVMPAALIKGHPTTHPEATMHGGAPSIAGSFHYVIAIFDQKSGERITDAQVTGKASLPGHLQSQEFTFGEMTIADTPSYGAYVTYGSTGRYQVEIQIKRPGVAEPVVVNFVDEYRKTHL